MLNIEKLKIFFAPNLLWHMASETFFWLPLPKAVSGPEYKNS